ncbi:MAG: hypothetical protein CVU98_04250 [Firmicutes bacterium HGW-Firmicutes-3]|jgi:type IV pilus assembly protein PilM|nr:MAG: hypothetical protein CVU98_04250 [Firmicutes bacterium HGW-Firmicutes-3]
MMKNKKMKNIMVLDMDAQAVRILVGNVSKNEISVKKVCSRLLPEDTYQDGRIMNHSAMEATIKELIKSNKIKVNQCICCFDSSLIIARDVLVPNNAGANFQDMAKYEVAQFLPVEINRYVVQSKRVHEVEIDGKPYIEALSTAIPNEMVEQFYKMLQDIGLKPVALDIHSNALGKFIEAQGRINGDTIGSKTVAVIDFGYESIFVSIFDQGQFKLSRTIQKGIKELDGSISRSININKEDATSRRTNVQSMKMNTENEVVDDEMRIVNVMRSTLENWFEEIEKVFRYHTSRNKMSTQIEKIYIYGEITKIKDMPEYLKGFFNIDTERIDKIKNIDWSATGEPKEVTEYLYALGATYRR